jgi:hypothetical protein
MSGPTHPLCPLFGQRFHGAFASPRSHILIEHCQDRLKLLGCYIGILAANKGQDFGHMLC